MKLILNPQKENGTVVLVDSKGTKYNCPNEAMDAVRLALKSNSRNNVRVSYSSGSPTIYKYSQTGEGLSPKKKGQFDLLTIIGTVTPNTENNNMAKEAKKEEPVSEIVSFLQGCYAHKPEMLKMTEINWKLLVRDVLRGKNVMMTGPAGCGKTIAVKAVATIFPDRELFIFNMGASQDPKSFLIGNTHFDRENGTYFAQSAFVKAIQTPKSIILLDEITRAHPDAGNILMSVLDYHQRYLRIDDADDAPIIKVAEGVSFLATANIGNEYTGTRVQDRALKDRFEIVEMPPLNGIQELELLTFMFPKLPKKSLKALAEIAEATRMEIKSENSKISTIVSTRGTVEMGELMMDGFTLAEAAEVKVFPLFPEEGGADSERTFVKQIVQKYIVVEEKKDIFNTEGEDKDFDNLPDDRPF